MRSNVTFYQFDADYIEALQSGDSAVAEHFFCYFSPLLRAHLQRRGIPAHAAEDIQQETFVRVLHVLRTPQSIKYPERFGAFVLSVCSNVRHEYARKEQYVSVGEHLTLLDHAPTPETLAASSELLEHVYDALVRMSEHDRKVLTMTLLDEKSNEEASRELNIGHSSFRVTLHRARGRFRKQIAFMLGMPLSSGMLTATE